MHKEETEGRRIMVRMWWGWRRKIKIFAEAGVEQVNKKARRW